MKASINELVGFSFCPKFYEQGGHVAPLTDYALLVRQIVEFAFRHDMESGGKFSWARFEKKWKSLCEASVVEFTQKEFNQSILLLTKLYDWYTDVNGEVLAVNYSMSSSLVYGHQLVSEIPVVIQTAGKVDLVFILNSTLNENLLFVEPSVRYTSVVLNEDLPVNKIYVLAVGPIRLLSALEMKPTNRYFESALLDFASVMQSMQIKTTYPNTSSCITCPLVSVCEAVNVR